MSGITSAGVLGLLGGLLLVLSWVGWRYFAAPRAAEDRAAAAPSRPAAEGPGSRPGRALTLRLRNVLYWGAASAFCAAALVAGVFLLSERVALDPLAALQLHRQAHIQALLNPERLAPPPSLPPSMFLGSERPALETADRDWEKLDRQFTQSVLRVLAKVAERGYSFALLEGYRSPERQDILADLGNHVTNARAYQSRHQFGLAVDLAPLRDGRLLISERDPWAMAAYSALGEEAERRGLVWGGRWALKDYGHVEAPATKASGGAGSQTGTRQN